MRKIIKIVGHETWSALNKKSHSRTHALLDDGTIAEGYGLDFEVGDEVMVAFHKQKIKMIKKSIDKS